MVATDEVTGTAKELIDGVESQKYLNVKPANVNWASPKKNIYNT